MLPNEISIYENESIRNSLKKLNKTAHKVLLIVDKDQRLLGTITDGDIRRHILRGKSLEDDISEVFNRNPHYLKKENFSINLVKKIMIEKKMELLPILDKENKVIDFITWNQAFSDGKKRQAIIKEKIDVQVIIMAGGKGSRLEPFSKILPKPLIPIGEKPIVEMIIDEFKKQGICEYFLTLNYKGEMIKSYFDNIEKDYEIKYVLENGFFGTASSLKLLEDQLKDVFIVSNCDVMVKANFKEVLNLHIEQNALLTILSSVQHHKIPYGVLRLKEGGEIAEILEKPEYTFIINAGVYILSKETLRFIPEKKSFDMTDLIETLIKNNKKVVTYPVNENDYIDIGQWEEYKKSIEKLRIFT